MSKNKTNDGLPKKPNSDSIEKFLFGFDMFLVVALAIAILAYLVHRAPWVDDLIIAISFLGLIPVAKSAVKSLLEKKLSIDLLASIALVFSLLAGEWASAAFISIMLASARVFDTLTQMRAKRTIENLMKYHVEEVKVRIGDAIKVIHIKEVKAGNMVVVESGDRMPVDGVVVSGEAEVDESSLTGESELVPKKSGDKVFTSTINESGSLIVKVEKVGADTTLSQMIALVEEAGRNKSRAERSADRFAGWYISITLVASITMYILGLNSREILAVLLVVCADDVAVAVPLAFTAAIMRAARRGVIVKGSDALEQLSKIKYLLTDKTGTLTRGKPKVVEVKAYGGFSVEKITRNFASGASESGHAVSKAIKDFVATKGISPHAPDEFEEVPGQGIRFLHDGDKVLLGRLSFMEKEKCKISEEVKKDIGIEKDAGRGISCLAMNGEVVGLLSYSDELRPRAKEIIAETKKLGISEWHMLSGDNERAASLIARELGIKHFHGNMTPESKAQFIAKFEKEHSSKKKGGGIVGYVGDGVNDAASLAIAPVSMAMGGIGSAAAVEAADVVIMKDKLERIPETIKIAKKTSRIVKQNFAIWAITNCVGLALVVFGFIGPSGAAAYNFITDFIPIGNALRAGKK